MIKLSPFALTSLTLRRLLPISLLLFSLSIVLLLLVLPLSQQGMSLDGIVYAAIAKNMAVGKGTAWDPLYSQTIWAHFYEHPSLVFYLQSRYFKLFGEHYWVERAYDVTMAVLQFSMVAYLWFRGGEHKRDSLSWLMLLWILVPLNVLAYKYNYIEATASCFSTAAALCLIRVRTLRSFSYLSSIALGGIFVFLGFMSNGPVYTFPLIIPLLQALCFKDQTYRMACIKTAVMMLSLILFATCFFYFLPGAKQNIQAYLNTQLLASFKGTHFATDHGRITNAYFGWSHLYILVHFLRAYWLATLMVGLLFLVRYFQQGQVIVLAEQHKSYAFFFLGLALLSSLPIGISPRMIFHYLIPSAPFYVLFLMYLSVDAWSGWLNLLRQKARLLMLSSAIGCLCFLISSAILISHFGQFNRHKAILHDVALLKKTVPNDEIIDASNEVLVSGLVGAYLARESFISITRGRSHRYFISLKKEKPLGKPYEVVPIETATVTLWRKP